MATWSSSNDSLAAIANCYRDPESMGWLRSGTNQRMTTSEMQQLAMQQQANAWNNQLAAQQQNQQAALGALQGLGQHMGSISGITQSLVSAIDAEMSQPTKKGKAKMNMLREYMNKHRDILFTLITALLVDHFVLNGALRHRIQKVIEAALSKIEKALGVDTTEVQVIEHAKG